MNIMTDRWIPVVRRSGAHALIAPAGLACEEDAPVRLNFARADWNLAGLELLIGLVYVAAPPHGAKDWHERRGAHDPDRLGRAFDGLAPWFSLDADEGPRFLQDLEPLSGASLPCNRLFIDAPGALTIEKNTDLMVKRDPDLVLSRASAAIALYTLQQFAPSGGAGNRTSMRGGGPLVTLVEPAPGASLMDIVWANTPYGQALDPDSAIQRAAALPWCAPTRTSGQGAAVVDEPLLDTGPSAEVFFGQPRRIRLDFGEHPDVCGMTRADDERPVIGFRQVKHGTNYGRWRHPATPYYRMKEDEKPLPVHPQPGRLGYRQYRGTVFGRGGSELRMRAACIDTYDRDRDDGAGSARVILGGWAMDNAKAMDFVLSHAPAPLSMMSMQAEASVIRAIEAAEVVHGSLRAAAKQALRIEPVVTDAVSTTTRAFFTRTETDFRTLIGALMAEGDREEAMRAWKGALAREAFGLFDRATLSQLLGAAPQRAERVLAARRLIGMTIGGYGKLGTTLFTLLGLEPPPKAAKKKKASAATSPRRATA